MGCQITLRHFCGNSGEFLDGVGNGTGNVIENTAQKEQGGEGASDHEPFEVCDSGKDFLLRHKEDQRPAGIAHGVYGIKHIDALVA